MKTNINRFKGDSETMYEITECLRNRILDQKFIYLGDGGENYYEYDGSFWGKNSDKIVTVNDWNNLIKRNGLFQGTSIFNFISIACGNSFKEKNLINSLGVKNINYVGVDFSEEMLHLSTKNLEDVDYNTSLIRSDIKDIDFKRYLDDLRRKNEKRFFSFLGNTFGNIRTTNITDLLGSYLKKGDVVGIDIAIKSEDSIKGSIEIFNHYKDKTANNELWREYILSGFRYINFPVEKGKIIIETKEDSTVGVYKVIFFLEMLENVEFKLEGNIIISKGERIKFFDVYFYQPSQLIDFMKLHHFKNLDMNLKESQGQFLFEKE